MYYIVLHCITRFTDNTYTCISQGEFTTSVEQNVEATNTDNNDGNDNDGNDNDIQEKKVIDDDDDEVVCSICWEILSDDTIRFGENCAHPFCSVCWIDYHKVTRHNRLCPVCRTLLKAKSKRGRPKKNAES